MFENLVVIQNSPDDTWLSRLRRGNYLWLAKEKRFGIVEWEFETEIGFSSGRIGFRQFDGHWKSETWMVRPDGKGINYSQLFLPVEGHVPQSPLTLPKSEIRKLIRQVGSLTQRVERLESRGSLANFWVEPYTLFPVIQETDEIKEPCNHPKCTVKFDRAEAATMTSAEVRKNFPRFFGTCPDCKEQVIIYSSTSHYQMGDW